MPSAKMTNGDGNEVKKDPADSVGSRALPAQCFHSRHGNVNRHGSHVMQVAFHRLVPAPSTFCRGEHFRKGLTSGHMWSVRKAAIVAALRPVAAFRLTDH